MYTRFVWFVLLSIFQARELFLQGVELEQDGKMFDAILKYKKAVHLVPDIEKRAFAFTQNNTKSDRKEQSPDIQSVQGNLYFDLFFDRINTSKEQFLTNYDIYCLSFVIK